VVVSKATHNTVVSGRYAVNVNTCDVTPAGSHKRAVRMAPVSCEPAVAPIRAYRTGWTVCLF
jgi:hypothetical protein